MPYLTLLAFVFLVASFISLWFKQILNIWGAFFFLSVFTGFAAGNIHWIGFDFIVALMILWTLYDRYENVWLFIFLIIFSVCYKFRLIPGYQPYLVAPNFYLGLEIPLTGLFPLAYVVLLAKNYQDWKAVFKGVLWGCIGIAILAIVATLSRATHWQSKAPTLLGLRLLCNFIFTCIPEEGFFRGFVQNKLCEYFKDFRQGSVAALVLTALLFALTHLLWSPNLVILGFTFLAGLLYGAVYMISGKIESAIITHFILNVIYMIYF